MERNEQVNKVTKKAVERRKTNNLWWNSLEYINQNITKAKKFAVLA